MKEREFGTMEKWNSGIMGKQLKPFNPIFHSSIFHCSKFSFHYSKWFLRKIAFHINRSLFVNMCSFFSHHSHPCMSVKIIFVVLSTMIDKEILFLIDEF